MPVQSFSFPLPETRFFQARHQVYKFKIRSGSKCSDEMINNEHATQELEDAVRVVLANLDCLQPFATKHFNVFPYKSRWERVSDLQFQHGGLKLTAYPFLLTLYLETHDAPRTHTANWSWDRTPVRAAEPRALHLPQSLARQHKSSRTESPTGGSATQHTRGRDREPPQRADGAEAMAGDRRSPAHSVAAHPSSASSDVTQSEKQKDGGAQVEQGGRPWTAEQGDAEEPARSDPERGEPGILALLASKVFPFSLFFGRWKK